MEDENNRRTTLNGIYGELNRQLGGNFKRVDEYMRENYDNNGYYGGYNNDDGFFGGL